MLKTYRDLVGEPKSPRALPGDLRARLLEIPASTPARGPWRMLSAPLRPPSFVLRSPALAAMASYVLVVGLFAVGNPYRLGRDTLAEIRTSTAPVLSRGADLVAGLRAAGSDLETRVEKALGPLRSEDGPLQRP